MGIACNYQISSRSSPHHTCSFCRYLFPYFHINHESQLPAFFALFLAVSIHNACPPSPQRPRTKPYILSAENRSQLADILARTKTHPFHPLAVLLCPPCPPSCSPSTHDQRNNNGCYTAARARVRVRACVMCVRIPRIEKERKEIVFHHHHRAR